MNRRLALGGALLLGGCRPDPGSPNYPNPDAWDPTSDDPDFVESDSPFEEGDERLSIGVFYEGGFSEELPIDNETRHVYVYDETYSIGVSEDRFEGLSADSITITGAQAWWGGGVHWDQPTDLSAWTTMHVALASTDGSFAAWTLGMSDGITEARVDVGELGFIPDGTWHSLRIPLGAFPGLDLSQITVVMLVIGESGTAGDVLLIDDVYFTKE